MLKRIGRVVVLSLMVAALAAAPAFAAGFAVFGQSQSQSTAAGQWHVGPGYQTQAGGNAQVQYGVVGAGYYSAGGLNVQQQGYSQTQYSIGYGPQFQAQGESQHQSQHSAAGVFGR